MNSILEQDLPRLRKNYEAMIKLHGDSIQLERKLHRTKWFDYRFLSALEATELFVKEYSSAYEHYFGKYFNSEAAEGKTGVRQGLWKSSLRVRPETSRWIAEFSEHEAD
jgi:hypothetical protein